MRVRRLSNLLVLKTDHKDPNSLPQTVNIEENKGYDNRQEQMIVLPSDTVVQILAMMIEILCTTVAFFTVVAAGFNITPA